MFAYVSVFKVFKEKSPSQRQIHLFEHLSNNTALPWQPHVRSLSPWFCTVRHGKSKNKTTLTWTRAATGEKVKPALRSINTNTCNARSHLETSKAVSSHRSRLASAVVRTLSVARKRSPGVTLDGDGGRPCRGSLSQKPAIKGRSHCSAVHTIWPIWPYVLPKTQPARFYEQK